MREYGFSLTRILPYKDKIFILCSLNFYCFSKFKDVMTLYSKVAALKLKIEEICHIFPKICAVCTYRYLIIAN